MQNIIRSKVSGFLKNAMKTTKWKPLCTASSATDAEKEGESLFDEPEPEPEVKKTDAELRAEFQKQLSEDKSIILGSNKLHYVEVGFGDQAVFCFPDAFGSIQQDFMTILENLDYNKFRFLCWDPPAHGKSRPRPHAYEPKNFRGFYLRREGRIASIMMDNLRYGKYSALGWGSGGVSAISMAIEFPDYVEKIATWGSPSFLDPLLLERDRNFADWSKWDAKKKEEALALYEEDYLTGLLKAFEEAAVKRHEDGEFYFTQEELNWLRKPVLVIHGDEDEKVSYKHARYLEEHLDNPTVKIIRGGGHDLQKTHTTEFMDLIQTFLFDAPQTKADKYWRKTL